MNELKVKHVWQPQAFDSLDVDIYVDDVELHAGQNYKVVYYGHKTFLPQVNSHHHLLSIKQKSKNSSISGEQLLSIYLPSKQLYELTLRSDDGNIDFAGVIKAKNVSLDSDDGDIKIDHLTANRGHVSSDDGDVIYKGNDYDNDDGGFYRSHLNQ